MTKPILWMAVLIIAGLLTTDLMAILVFSRRLYLPIDEIDTMVKKGIRYVDGTVEGTDEDDGLRDRVQYMLDVYKRQVRALDWARRARAYKSSCSFTVNSGPNMPRNSFFLGLSSGVSLM